MVAVLKCNVLIRSKRDLGMAVEGAIHGNVLYLPAIPLICSTLAGKLGEVCYGAITCRERDTHFAAGRA